MPCVKSTILFFMELEKEKKGKLSSEIFNYSIKITLSDDQLGKFRQLPTYPLIVHMIVIRLG